MKFLGSHELNRRACEKDWGNESIKKRADLILKTCSHSHHLKMKKRRDQISSASTKGKFQLDNIDSFNSFQSKDICLYAKIRISHKQFLIKLSGVKVEREQFLLFKKEHRAKGKWQHVGSVRCSEKQFFILINDFLTQA